MLITVDGKLKVIDFGAAVDMCTGINFNPEAGMLDPRRVGSYILLPKCVPIPVACLFPSLLQAPMSLSWPQSSVPGALALLVPSHWIATRSSNISADLVSGPLEAACTAAAPHAQRTCSPQRRAACRSTQRHSLPTLKTHS